MDELFRPEELAPSEQIESHELCTLQGVPIWQDEPLPGQEFGRVHWISDFDVDADGANGATLIDGVPQWAYRTGDRGLDALANVGYPSGDYQSVLICGSNGRPIPFSGGGFASKTAWRDRTKDAHDPTAYLDSCSVPYTVIEGFIRRFCKGVALGALARITYLDLSVWDVVGDIGPLYKIGEGSIAAANEVGINPNPRRGGVDWKAGMDVKKGVRFEFWPGVPAELLIGGAKRVFELQRFVPASA